MLEQYTELFKEYLAKNDVPNTKYTLFIKPKFSQFPSFNINGLNISFYEMFVEKYDLREIGSETEELFEHYLNETLNEMLVKYVPKLYLYISKFNNLYDRKIELKSNGDNRFYLNPVNSVVENNKLQNANEYSEIREKNLAPLTSNATLLKTIMDIKDIYNECLNSFNKVFMGAL